MKLCVSSGSLEMSDITKIWGWWSIWIAGGHCCWARARPARSRMPLIRDIMSGMPGQWNYGAVVVVLRTI